MDVIQKIVVLLGWSFVGIGSLFMISSAVGFTRNKDFFVRVHAVLLSNIYGITFVLFGIAITDANLATFAKLFLIIILNILVTLTTINVITRIPVLQGMKINAINRKDLNKPKENLPQNPVQDQAPMPNNNANLITQDYNPSVDNNLSSQNSADMPQYPYDTGLDTNLDSYDTQSNNSTIDPYSYDLGANDPYYSDIYGPNNIQDNNVQTNSSTSQTRAAGNVDIDALYKQMKEKIEKAKKEREAKDNKTS